MSGGAAASALFSVSAGVVPTVLALEMRMAGCGYGWSVFAALVLYLAMGVVLAWAKGKRA